MWYIILNLSHGLDVNECLTTTTNNCHSNADCSNTDGSFECKCIVGYVGDGTSCDGNICLMLYPIV